jgi:hypothetical protein
MKASELKKIIREEIANITNEAFPILEGFNIGDKVKVKTPELADYNKTGVIEDQAPSGKYYMVRMKSGLAYFHESDLKKIS